MLCAQTTAGWSVAISHRNQSKVPSAALNWAAQQRIPQYRQR
jgi:hypothetical protein